MPGTVDITLRVMHHTECDVYDQNQPPRTKRPCPYSQAALTQFPL